MDGPPEHLVERGVLSAPDTVWELAVQRAAVISRLAQTERVGVAAADAAAAELGISRRRVYMLVRRWREGSGLVSDLIVGRSSGGRGRGRLSDEVETVVREILRSRYLGWQRRSLAVVHREVARACKARGLPVPSRGALERRVARLPRLLRTLLAELTESPAQVGARSGATLRLIWQNTGQPERAGLNVWQPYEYLDWPRQQTMLHAAAVALELAAAGEILARGTLGPLLVPKPDQVVYAGDEPSRLTLLWRQIQREINDMIERAHHEPEIAQQLLSLFTLSCKTVEAYDRERHYVIGLGIPAEFLPTAAASGRPGLAAQH